MVHKISRPQALRLAIFSKCPPSAILFLMDSSQKLIRSSQIPRKPPRQIWLRSNQRFIRYRAHKLYWAAIFSKYPLSAILLLIIFSQKLIRSFEITSEPQHQIWMQSNQWFIWYRAQCFLGGHFFNCSLSAILFLINSSQKLIRSSEIPGEPPIKFEWKPFKG